MNRDVLLLLGAIFGWAFVLFLAFAVVMLFIAMYFWMVENTQTFEKWLRWSKWPSALWLICLAVYALIEWQLMG